MIFVTGDCHSDFRRFSSKIFYEQKEMNKDDFVIICGDFGGVWKDSPEERYWLDWLNDKPFTTLFIDGNHENFDRLYSGEFPVVDFHGGRAHQIRESIYHLMRGYVFELQGKKFFAFGGASSHDISDGIIDRDDYDSDDAFKAAIKEWNWTGKMFRINHLSWWKEELPSDEEMQRGLDSLAAVDNAVDFVVTHCCPQSIASFMSMGAYKADYLTEYFNEVLGRIKFKKWFFGHYHDNQMIMSDMVELYEQIIRIV